MILIIIIQFYIIFVNIYLYNQILKKGGEVPNFDHLEKNMCKLEVPSTTYAVFTTSGYEIDDSKLDFKFYDQRCHPWEYNKMVMEIYVPIKRV